jgi:N-acetylneuraminic acid mutarotase
MARAQLPATHQIAAPLFLAIALLASPSALSQSAAQTGEWAWIGGSNLTGFSTGVFGTQGVPSRSNLPGDRDASANWSDSSGNLWLFGGSAAGNIRFNDLWQFSPTLNQWTWFSGGATIVGGTYGTLGVPAPANVPGVRQQAVGWTDRNGNIWLFGGWGYDTNQTLTVLNDLWEFSPKTLQWTWIAGNSTAPNANDSCWPGVYGTPNVAAPGNFPGGRMHANSWTDSAGNFWLFSGAGCDAAGIQGLLNDLWEFSPTTKQWTYISGAKNVLYTADGATGVYGTLGTPAPANYPGGRQLAALLGPDASGNIWIFGGDGYDSTGHRGFLNDLWQYSPSTKLWTWMSGSNTVPPQTLMWPTSQPNIYGTLGQFAAANTPGGREETVGTLDSQGNPWIFGGDTENASGFDVSYNDLWQFDPVTHQWAWVSGSNTQPCAVSNSTQGCLGYGSPPTYGKLGVFSPTNVPGSRESEAAWSDSRGNLWIFGGYGIDSVGNDLLLTDLWEFAIKSTPAVALASSASPVFAANSVTLTASIPFSAPAPTGSVTFYDNGNSIGTAILNASGQAALTSSTLAVGSQSIVASYAGDANFFPANSPTVTQTIEDFTITPTTSTASTANPGSSASYSFALSPASPATTFPGSITLSATGGPAGTTFAFSPASIAGGAASTPVTLTVTVPVNLALQHRPARRPGISIALALLLMPLLTGVRRLRNVRRRLTLFALLLVSAAIATAALTGCSSGGSSNSTQPQTYVIVVGGTAGGLNHSTSVSLTIN